VDQKKIAWAEARAQDAELSSRLAAKERRRQLADAADHRDAEVQAAAARTAQQAADQQRAQAAADADLARRAAQMRWAAANGARDDFLLAATAQNLRKLAKLIPIPQPAAVR
jgi:hypothetical protein